MPGFENCKASPFTSASVGRLYVLTFGLSAYLCIVGFGWPFTNTDVSSCILCNEAFRVHSVAWQKCLVSWVNSRIPHCASWSFDQVLPGCLWLCGPTVATAQASAVPFLPVGREGKTLGLPWLLFPGKHLSCLICWEMTWRSITGRNPLENYFLVENG